jgi:hypothetical protein
MFKIGDKVIITSVKKFNTGIVVGFVQPHFGTEFLIKIHRNGLKNPQVFYSGFVKIAEQSCSTAVNSI